MTENLATNKQIFCYNCNKFTRTIEPISLQRIKYDKFHIYGICENCISTKSKFVFFDRDMFPDIFFVIPARKTFLNNIILDNNEIVNIYRYVDKIIN